MNGFSGAAVASLVEESDCLVIIRLGGAATTGAAGLLSFFRGLLILVFLSTCLVLGDRGFCGDSRRFLVASDNEGDDVEVASFLFTSSFSFVSELNKK